MMDSQENVLAQEAQEVNNEVENNVVNEEPVAEPAVAAEPEPQEVTPAEKPVTEASA